MAVLHKEIAVGPSVFGARVNRSQLTGRGVPPSLIFRLLEPLLRFFWAWTFRRSHEPLRELVND
ncbi:hypothetical protein WJ78_24445 [Burkholderia ubonensis]|nr:hypothetical protein WJ78_24445 [Burkholderia ubonensis]KVP91204.1 hypothetical protein WJ97_03540 [Burkholderia ubonensis]OJB44989.1 hypothetical protein BGV57_06010 [Burkholderia ubonensis]